MLKNIVMVVNRKGSKGSRDIAKALGIKRLKCEFYNQDATPFAVGWGHSKAAIRQGLNPGLAVDKAADKRLAFAAFQAANVPCIKWTTDKAVAKQWFDDGHTVVARTKVRASCGHGIVICRSNHPEANAELVEAPLYTRYKNKDREVRVHVFRGKVIAVAEKKRRRGVAYRGLKDKLVQAHENGWVFCTEAVEVPQFAKQVALDGCTALGLDFGAADVIIRKGKAYMIEFNTAPAAVGRTLTAYVQAFEEFIRENNNIITPDQGRTRLQRRPRFTAVAARRRKQRHPFDRRRTG